METCINYCEPGWAWMSTDERKWITKIRKLAEQHPDECIIMKQPEDNGGFIYVKYPQSWVKVAPPVKRNLTDEQREALSERFKRMREQKKANAEE